MTTKELTALQYPIGQFVRSEVITPEETNHWLRVLQQFPNELYYIVKPLTESQLKLRYRPDGWTIRQVVHHIADSHHHLYIRFKWAMTEDNPTIKPYNEKVWAEMHDYNLSTKLSLKHIDVVHAKLVNFLKGLSQEDLERTFVHPEAHKTITIRESLGIYAWHSQHHLAHIKNALRFKY